MVKPRDVAGNAEEEQFSQPFLRRVNAVFGRNHSDRTLVLQASQSNCVENVNDCGKRIATWKPHVEWLRVLSLCPSRMATIHSGSTSAIHCMCVRRKISSLTANNFLNALCLIYTHEPPFPIPPTLVQTRSLGYIP